MLFLLRVSWLISFSFRFFSFSWVFPPSLPCPLRFSRIIPLVTYTLPCFLSIFSYFTFSFLNFICSRNVHKLTLPTFSFPLVFSCSFLCAVSLFFLLGSCVGFHSVLSFLQHSFVKESVREISIALLLVGEGCGIQVCPSGWPFSVWLLISFLLLWMVWHYYDCLIVVSAPLLNKLALFTDKSWVAYHCPLNVFLCCLHLHPSNWSFVDL